MLNAHYLIAFIAGIWAAWALYQWMPVPAAVDKAALSRVMASGNQKEERLPFWRALLLPFNRLAQKLPSTLVGNTRKQLYWAQFQGEWIGWTVVEFWGLRIAATLVGLAVGLALSGGLLAVAFPAIVFFYLGVKLDTSAGKATKQLQRELPEVAQTLALLVGTGKSESEALREVSRGKGIVHEWIRRVLATRPPDCPLLSDIRGKQRGYLREEAIRSGISSLINFATQLDFLKASGIGAELLLGNLADTVAEDYAAQANRRAEELGDMMVPVATVFYFVPYLAGLLAPILVGSLTMAR